MAKKKYIIPSEDALRTIRERLDYDGKRGRLVWKVDIPRWGITAGDEAGCAKQHAAGHREHQVKVAGRQYASARVAWFLAEGAWPTGSVIPLNGDQHDLRSVNLAMALNLRRAERGVQYRGVSWDKSSQRWLAGIYGGGRRRHLGRFADPREAALAYDRAALELRGAAAVLNFPSAPTGRVPKAPAWTAPASIGTPCEGPRP